MLDCEQEARELFKALSLENQDNILAFTRLVYAGECLAGKKRDSSHLKICTGEMLNLSDVNAENNSNNE